MSTIETDYLVIGGGAAAMAFVDTLLDETEARIVVVDRHDQPGGHWNDAYPFVRLHQPSAYYGVGSRELGRGIRYPSGPNAGGYELATKAAILDYYDQLMQERFLPSGRVVWFPMSEYRQGPDDSHQVTSLLGGARVDVVVTKKLVDATQVRTEAPAALQRDVPGPARPRQRVAGDPPTASVLHRRRRRQDGHGRLPVAAGQRGRAGAHPLDPVAGSVGARPRLHAAVRRELRDHDAGQHRGLPRDRGGEFAGRPDRALGGLRDLDAVR
jgi:hypothetical protein